MTLDRFRSWLLLLDRQGALLAQRDEGAVRLAAAMKDILGLRCGERSGTSPTGVIPWRRQEVRTMSVVQEVIYPESDGKPMADNTKQARWIFCFFGNLCALFRDAADVFVAADNLWYPVEGEDKVRIAPDVYVVFGRPKGDRGSYKQWEEGGVPLTVVFEILSPGNDPWEMDDKKEFYEEHGVEEYYLYDPETNRLKAYIRGRMGAALVRQPVGSSFASPRLKIRFDLTGPEMRVFYPDGKPFLAFEELAALQERETARADAAEKRADDESALREQAEARAARMAELGRKARRGLASADEIAELEQLEGAA